MGHGHLASNTRQFRTKWGLDGWRPTTPFYGRKPGFTDCFPRPRHGGGFEPSVQHVEVEAGDLPGPVSRCDVDVFSRPQAKAPGVNTIDIIFIPRIHFKNRCYQFPKHFAQHQRFSPVGIYDRTK